MPTEEEWCAIVACANKAKNAYGGMYDTQKQHDIVMAWAKKWMEQREKNKTHAKEYMRKRREIDPDYGHYYTPKRRYKKGTTNDTEEN